MKKISAALVGFGYSGKTFHAPLMSAQPGISLDYLNSSKNEEVKQFYPDVKVIEKFEELLSIETLQLIVLATPNGTHFDFARRALESGKHAVIDKPFVITSSEGEELIRIAKDNNLLLSVFHNRRWDSDFLTLQNVIATRKLGTLNYFEAHYDRFRPRVENRWRENPLPGSGILYDLGAHLIDQALVLFGKPDSITADLEMQRAGAKAVDYFHLILKYGTLRVVLHGSCLAKKHALRYILHGDNGSYVKSGIDPQEEGLKKGILPGDTGWGEEKPEAYGETEYLEDQLEITDSISSKPGCYEKYYEGVALFIGTSSKNPVSAGDALMVIKIIEAAMLSNELKKSIVV
jgi:scyllo-inositol 2-dehydrogenase (NADP+)